MYLQIEVGLVVFLPLIIIPDDISPTIRAAFDSTIRMVMKPVILTTSTADRHQDKLLITKEKAMKFIVDVIVEVKPLLWLLATIIAFITEHPDDGMLLACITLLDFLTVYALLWSRENKRR